MASKIVTAKNKLADYWSYFRKNTPMVLLYHRVEILDSDPQLLAVTPDLFYEQINFLKKNYHPLTTEEFYHQLCDKKPLPPKSILITFDDGYADNLIKALPVLESLNTEALFFITTSLIGTDKELWWDELERVLLTNEDLPPDLDLKVEQSKYHFATSSTQQRKETYTRLHPVLKYIDHKKRKVVLDQLRTWAKLSETGRASHRLMTWDEIKLMSISKSAVIGAHTINHVPLSILTFEEQLAEIKQSKQQLESAIGKAVNYFSYPYGTRRDFNDQTVTITKQCNFLLGFANYPGYVHSSTNHLKIPRILVRNWTAEELGINLAKFHG